MYFIRYVKNVAVCMIPPLCKHISHDLITWSPNTKYIVEMSKKLDSTRWLWGDYGVYTGWARHRPGSYVLGCCPHPADPRWRYRRKRCMQRTTCLCRHNRSGVLRARFWSLHHHHAGCRRGHDSASTPWSNTKVGATEEKQTREVSFAPAIRSRQNRKILQHLSTHRAIAHLGARYAIAMLHSHLTPDS